MFMLLLVPHLCPISAYKYPLGRDAEGMMLRWGNLILAHEEPPLEASSWKLQLAEQETTICWMETT